MTSTSWKAVTTHLLAAITGASAAAATISQLNLVSKTNEPKGHIKNDEDSLKGITPQHVSPTLPITILRPNDDLEIAFDARTRNPVYVMERLGATTKSSPAASSISRTNKSFYEEKSLSASHRSRNNFYKYSGFDRGHMAPAADFSHNDDAMADTFNLCNISPQVPSFNRGIWSRLEQLIRDIAKEEVEGRDGYIMYVVTGPLWLPSAIVNDGQKKQDSSVSRQRYEFTHEAIGIPPTLISVPTHYFKLVVILKNDGEKENTTKQSCRRKIEQYAAFVLPNSSDGAKQPKDMRHVLVRLSDLETVSGMHFFPNLWVDDESTEDDAEGQKSLADILTEDIWIKEEEKRSKYKESIVVADDPILLMDGAVSKRRREKVKKTIKRLEKSALKHICGNNRCSDFL